MSHASLSENGDYLPKHRHDVQFYESNEHLTAAVARYLFHGFDKGNAIVVIARPEHGEGFKQELVARGCNVAAAIEKGQFREFDAQETLAQFMDADLPNPERFRGVIGDVIDDCRRGREHSPVLAYGEMVDILWRSGKHEAAIRLEQLWNDLAHTRPFELFCAYALNGFYKGTDQPHFEEICRSHSRVYPTERHMNLPEEERLRHVSMLEQRSLVLEAEIEQRKAIEKALLGALEEKRRAEEALKKSESQVRTLLQNAAEGIHWVGPDGRIIWANDAEFELLGYSPHDFIGHDIREFHADSDVIADILNRLARHEGLHNQPARLRAKDGSIRHVLINSNAFFENGEFVHTQCFTRDVTALKELQDAQAFLSAVVESADDAVISKTLDGIITTWNPGAERVFGYSAGEVVGKPVTILFPPENYNEEPRILAKIRRGERIEHYETRRMRKDGSIIDISLTVSPIRNDAGEVIGASKVARDITARKRLQAERDELLKRERIARSQAESANRAKDEFLAVLSHELRTPLNAVIGWVNILESRNDQDLVARAIDVIKRNATIQKRMIEDLLDVARILTGKMVINSEPVDMRTVVDGVLDSFNPAASAKRIRVDKHFDAGVPLINGDADRLQQVVWNLVSNSIKFTPDGGYVQVELAHPVESHIEFSVRDTGQGIAPEFLPHVFDRFAQGDSSSTRLHGGLGIGLAVVRHLVEAHGGSVNVESPGEGLGATFRVRLPISS